VALLLPDMFSASLSSIIKIKKLKQGDSLPTFTRPKQGLSHLEHQPKGAIYYMIMLTTKPRHLHLYCHLCFTFLNVSPFNDVYGVFTVIIFCVVYKNAVLTWLTSYIINYILNINITFKVYQTLSKCHL
jgi:hypothetical protein